MGGVYRLIMMLAQSLGQRGNAWVGGGVAALLGLGGVAVIVLSLRSRQPGLSRLGALLVAAAVASVVSQRRRRPPRRDDSADPDPRRGPDDRTPGNWRR